MNIRTKTNGWFMPNFNRQITSSKQRVITLHYLSITLAVASSNQSMEITQLKKALLLLLVISLVSPLFVHSTAVKYCDKKGNYAVKIEDVEISPDPVVSGKPATFNLSASTGDLISGGKVVIDVNFFAIHVHSETHDLCEEVSCPIAPGSFVLSHSQTLPIFTPPGSYTLKMTMTDTNGEKLSCISFNFKITFGTFVLDQ